MTNLVTAFFLWKGDNKQVTITIRCCMSP